MMYGGGGGGGNDQTSGTRENSFNSRISKSNILSPY